MHTRYVHTLVYLPATYSACSLTRNAAVVAATKLSLDGMLTSAPKQRESCLLASVNRLRIEVPADDALVLDF